MSTLNEFDVYNHVDTIVGIKWIAADVLFSYNVGATPRKGSKITRITINTAGYIRYGHKSFVIYVRNSEGEEVIWKIIEGFPVELTLDTEC
jgi:hypothetical protein